MRKYRFHLHKLPTVTELAERWQSRLDPSEFTRRMGHILATSRHREKKQQAETILIDLSTAETVNPDLSQQTACCLYRNRDLIASRTAERLLRFGNLTGCLS